MTDLGPEWIPDGDGIPSRQGARLLIFDSAGNVLLVKGHDTHDADHNWWFTVGGGVEPDETSRQAAVREAAEETGFVIDEGDIVGPAVHRKAEFRFRNVLARQEEVFYVARLDEIRPALARQTLTELEEQTLDEFAWLSPAELEELAATETVYPEELPQLVRSWVSGWDGTLVELGPEEGWTQEL